MYESDALLGREELAHLDPTPHGLPRTRGHSAERLRCFP